MSGLKSGSRTTAPPTENLAYAIRAYAPRWAGRTRQPTRPS